MGNKITMDWSKISIVSLIAFLAGWVIFGLLGATIITILVLLMMGIIKIK